MFVMANMVKWVVSVVYCESDQEIEPHNGCVVVFLEKALYGGFHS